MCIRDSINTLLYTNSKIGRIDKEGEKTENKKYSQWFAETINVLLREKQQEISNAQVILRGVGADDRYKLSIIRRRIVEIIKEKRVSDALTALAKAPITKVKDNFINVHETVVDVYKRQRQSRRSLSMILRSCSSRLVRSSPVRRLRNPENFSALRLRSEVRFVRSYPESRLSLIHI